MIAQKVCDLIGNTKILCLENFVPSKTLFAKLEAENPGFCVKDRIALSMLDDAEQRGLLRRFQGDKIIEATSGNTGIGLAMIAARRGYQLILVMPESMSAERRKMMQYYGAKIVLTPAGEGMKGAVEKANELSIEEKAFVPQQFGNPANPMIHYHTTGPEFWRQSKGKIDILVLGVGTGGTITGAGKYLKEQNPKLHIVAVEPAESPVLSGGEAAPHKIQGLGAGFVPGVLERELIDEIIPIHSDDAIAHAQLLARKEGIAAGISSGAALAAALQIVKKYPGKQVYTLFPDHAERYLSTDLFAF